MLDDKQVYILTVEGRNYLCSPYYLSEVIRALNKLTPLDASVDKYYSVKNKGKLQIGTSICQADSIAGLEEVCSG